MRSVSFRVRRVYYDQIVKGDKKVELRAAEQYWNTRLLKLLDDGNENKVAVFLCGKDVHRRRIEKITVESASKVPGMLGREPSEQGRRDLRLDWNNYVWAIWLGEAL